MARKRSLQPPRGPSVSAGPRPVVSPAASSKASRLLELAINPDFLRESVAIIQEAQALGPLIEDEAQWATAWPEFGERCVRPFIKRWQAAPLWDQQLVAPDPRQPPALAIQAGRWGLIPVFPWTEQQDLLSRFRDIKRAIGRRSASSRGNRLGALASWMDMNQVPRAAIAAAVWGREGGLRRPTTSEAIARLSWDQETKLMKRFTARGLSNMAATRATYRSARKSEAPATAQVRTAIRRHDAAGKQLTQDLLTPERRDPVAGLMTAIFQADLARDPRVVSQLLAELRRTLLPRTQ